MLASWKFKNSIDISHLSVQSFFIVKAEKKNKLVISLTMKRHCSVSEFSNFLVMSNKYTTQKYRILEISWSAG